MQYQMPGQVAGASGGGSHDHGAMAAGGHDHSTMVHPKVPPKDSPVIQQYLHPDSIGPTLKKGKGTEVKIDDGKGFGDIKGRKQNGDDKKKNDYSQTDANFFPTMGVLMDVKTGKPMNYVKQIQAYNATGYISTFHPDVYQKMVATQDAGKGTILGMALNLMGVEGAQTDPGMAAAGLTAGQFGTEQVPGTPLQAKQVIMSGKDLAGEQWARPHHAESSWAVFKGLTDAGLDWKSAMVFSGDDAISGSGRLNGFNNQDGKDSVNADEAAVLRMAAYAQQSTGIPVFDIVAGGHAHTGIDDSAKTNPNINKLIGLPHGDRSSSPQRLKALREALLDGTVKSKKKNVAKFDVDAKGAFKGVVGNSQVLQNAQTAVMGASGDGDKKVHVSKTTPPPTQAPPTTGGGAGAPDFAAGGGCAHDPVQGANLIGGGPVDLGSIAAILAQLVEALTALVQALGAMSGVAGASGGGGVVQQGGTPGQAPAPAPAPTQGGGATTQQQPTPAAATTAAAGHDHAAHAH